MLLAGLPLGFSFIELLLHLFNLAILLIAFKFLLYKPIKKFMDKRQELFKQKEEDYQNTISETDELKKQAFAIIKDANKEAILIKDDAVTLASKEKDAIIAQARVEAEQILKKAQSDLKEKTIKMKEEISYTLSETAIDIAQRILEREIKVEDNDRIIDNILSDWKDQL